MATSDTATLRLRIFDGSRQLFQAPAKFLVRIVDGNQKQQVWKTYTKSDLSFSLPFFDNFGDNYTVLVSADGYRDAGFFPVKVSDRFTQTLDVMMVPREPGYSFATASWANAKGRYPFLASGIDDAAAESSYGGLMEREQPLACMLNVLEAAADLPLSQGTPLDYLRELCRDGDYAPRPDRCFFWCDAELVNQMRIGESVRLFAEAPSVLHAGATHSWKELRLSEADLQLTFHENDKRTIGGTKCVILELDIDYYKDPLAHTLFEVVPNGLTQTLTDPAEVYVLRWMAGRMAKSFEFEPLYILTDDRPKPAAAARPRAATAKSLKRRRSASAGKPRGSARGRS